MKVRIGDEVEFFTGQQDQHIAGSVGRVTAISQSGYVPSEDQAFVEFPDGSGAWFHFSQFQVC